MDLEAVKELAKLMEEKGLTTLEVEQEGQHICLKKEVPAVPQVQFAPAAPQAVAAVPVPAVSAPAAVSAAETAGVVDFNNVDEVKSPMVGTVYASSAPGEEPFVKVGDKVKEGQTLCIIEAMKLMNEFTAPHAGEIVDVCFEDGQLVEYGQCLFKIYPRS